MKTKLHLTFLFAMLLANTGWSQDTIYFKNGDVRITEIKFKSDKKVRYKLIEGKKSPIIERDMRDVKRIIFRNGEEHPIQHQLIRMDKRFGFNFGFLLGLDVESAYIVAGTDYFLTPGTSLELNYFSDGGYGGIFIGPKFYLYPYSRKSLKTYISAQLGSNFGEFAISIPLGFSYISKNGFEIKGGFNNIYYPHYGGEINAGISIGWRF